jgi:hypothetical protein
MPIGQKALDSSKSSKKNLPFLYDFLLIYYAEVDFP